MWERPDFLDLPAREVKPRVRGLTHVLDKGDSLRHVEGLLEGVAEFVDLVKLGWGTAYVDPVAKDRVALYQSAGALVCTGGTLFEIVIAQGRLDDFRRWAIELGVDAVEVSNGLPGSSGLPVLTAEEKTALVADLSRDLLVLAESGSKDECVVAAAEDWVRQMDADLNAGARWVIAEGRESGTVGLYEQDGAVRSDLADALVSRLPADRIIFEAPRKAQQAWFINRYGAGVNLGNIPLEEVLPLETLRLGLRADTAGSTAGMRLEPVVR
jgi:phosphosulfolactate synthase